MRDLYTCRGCGFLSTDLRAYVRQVDRELLCGYCVGLVANGMPLGSGYLPLGTEHDLPEVLAALGQLDQERRGYTLVDTGLEQRTLAQYQGFMEWLAGEMGLRWRDALAYLGPRVAHGSEVPGTLVLHVRWPASGHYDQFPIALPAPRHDDALVSR